MPRKAALIAEESNDTVPDSPLRRSTRSRVANSLAPEIAPVDTVGRTRRSSTSSVGSDMSVASVASLPASAKGGVRGRRPSLSQESNLEKMGETGKSSEVTLVKRTLGGSNSNLQDDASALSVRAGSPAVAAVTDRRRSLRSASQSPTSSIKDSAGDYAVNNGTPSKVRGRRSSVEKAAPKGRASVALEPLDEENEVETPKKNVAKAALQSVSEQAAVDNEEKMEEIADVIKSVESKETLDTAKKEHKKKRLSSESTKENDEVKSRVCSEQTKTKVDIKQSDDITKGLLTKKVREQFLSQTQVVISPLTNKISADKLSEMSELISNDIKVNEPSEQSDSSSLSTEIIPLKKTLDDIKSSPKRSNLTPQSPVRRSPRLISETVSDSSDTSVIKSEIPSNISKPVVTGRASLNSGKESRKSISKEPTPTKEIEETEIKSPSKSLDKSVEVVDGSDGSFHVSLKSTILSSQEDGLNKSNESNKDSDKSANIEHKLKCSNESDKENTDKRVSNVFTSKNTEESFFEAMDVEYPSDNDESFGVANKKRASMNKSLANTQVSNITSDDSTSGSLHLICSDDSHGEEKKTDLAENTKPISGRRQSIALIQLDPPTGIDLPIKNAVLYEPQPISSILDSRISILPDKVLTPVHAAKENDDLDQSLQLDASSSTKDNKSIVCEDPRKSIDSDDGFEMTDDESDEILAINTEMEDGTGNRELVHSKKTDKSFAKQKDSVEESGDEGLKTREESDDEEKQLQDTIIDSPEESDVENNPGNKLDAFVFVDSKDSSDTDCQQEEYDSNSAQTSDDSNVGKYTVKTSKKNKNKKYITVKSSDSSDTSDPESKLDQLIQNKTADFNEDSDQSDSEYNPDKFLDDEAEEVSDEDTPSEDSNEIIEIGESIESTDDELEDEEYASGSDADFIDDDDVGKLLSGNEDDNDLDYDGKVVVRKKRRIIRRPIDEMEDVEIPASKDEDKPVAEVQEDLGETSNKRKSKKKSSISVQENIKVGELDNTAITEKIGNIVDIFCSSFTESKGGNVTVNVSLDYQETSSNDEQRVEKKQSSQATAVKVNKDLNKSLKRKSAEKLTPSAANATSTCKFSNSNTGATSSKIKILQDVRISAADIEIAPIQVEQPTLAKKYKNKKKRNRMSNNPLDDEVFLPDSSSNSKSVEMLATPRPSNIGALPDNVIMELVRKEESTSKTDVSPEKKSKKRRKATMPAEEFNMFYKPSTSHAGTAGEWDVTELTPDIKPSKCNARKLVAESVKDMKDFKNIMIAKNKLKPQQSKKSFMSSLKTRKQF